MENFAGRAHEYAFGLGNLRHERRYIFEFESQCVYCLSEGADSFAISVGRAELAVGDLTGGAVILGGKGMQAVAHSAGFHGQHSPKLATAKNADRRAWGQ